MSLRAAWRLESLGFGDVYDYTVGKLDWLAAGLPTEGTNTNRPRAGALARKDVPTCGLEERLSVVRDRVRSQRWEAAEMAHSMVDHKLESSPITTSDGRLVGLLLQKDVVEAVRKSE